MITFDDSAAHVLSDLIDEFVDALPTLVRGCAAVREDRELVNVKRRRTSDKWSDRFTDMVSPRSSRVGQAASAIERIGSGSRVIVRGRRHRPAAPARSLFSVQLARCERANCYEIGRRQRF